MDAEAHEQHVAHAALSVRVALIAGHCKVAECAHKRFLLLLLLLLLLPIMLLLTAITQIEPRSVVPAFAGRQSQLM